MQTCWPNSALDFIESPTHKRARKAEEISEDINVVDPIDAGLAEDDEHEDEEVALQCRLWLQWRWLSIRFS